MKIKTVVISAAVTAGMVGGIGYGAYYTVQSQKKPVDVVPVANVNYGFWGDPESMSGTIISKNTQTVQLDGDKTLTKVYVKEGDEVKIGDPLLEYDMTMTELQREMEDLTRQTLDLNMQSLERNLDKWKRTSPTASLEVTNGILTASGDGLFEEGEIVSNNDGADIEDLINHDTAGTNAGSKQDGTSEENVRSDTGGAAAGLTSGNDGNASGGNSQDAGGGDSNTGSASDENTNDPVIDDNENGSGSGSGNGDNPSDGSGDFILDDDGEKNPASPETPENGEASDDLDSLIEDDDVVSSDTLPVSDQETILKNVDLFLNRFLLLPDTLEKDTELYGPDLEQALKVFREKLAVREEQQVINELGDRRTRVTYQLDPQIADLVGETTAGVLRKAYQKTCLYRFIYSMRQINADLETLENLSDETILSMEADVQQALEDYHALTEDTLDDNLDGLKSELELLGALIVRLRDLRVVEETEALSEEMTDTGEPQDDSGDGDYGGLDSDFSDGPDETYTAAEIKEMIEELERDIVDCQLDIRESELRLKQYDRELDKKIVRSNMNGVVKTAGSVEDNVAEENFIVITGETGMYVKGTVNELKLDKVSVGDTIQGTSYETGMSFTAKITEISVYPTENNDFWGYGSENSNASFYPFLAYIEDAEGLEEGDVELQMVDDNPSSGIYLENFFVLTENGNKKYVYIQGRDGLLKKQYVETGTSVYGEIEIKHGISSSDKIAFPYGKNVVEGAQTREVENLDSLYGYY